MTRVHTLARIQLALDGRGPQHSGLLLKEVRETRGVSRKRIAEILTIPEHFVRDAERGAPRRLLTPEQWVTLATYFDEPRLLGASR